MINLWSKTVERLRRASERSPLVRYTLCMVVLLVVMCIGGAVVLVSGIVPIKASSGHWPITHAVLHFAKQRSVATHTIGITPPPLDDRALIVKGAGHYEIGCRPCHGSPELNHPKIAHHMLPPPPYLPETGPRWKPQELFYMVKHGIKFTGMPAWPSQFRDDEVWAMVAFLQAFPTLTPDEYDRLVHGEKIPSTTTTPLSGLESEPQPAALTKSCNPCHGTQGQGREVAAFPKLAGQSPEYFIASMEAFARGERHSGIMEPIAVSVTSRQLKELARHYAGRKSSPSAYNVDQASIERGKQIARRGIPSEEVPACAECHDAEGGPTNPLYPRLSGQHADYLVLQLTLFKQDLRGGTSNAHLMRNAVAGMNDQQIRDVANYFASGTSQTSKSK